MFEGYYSWFLFCGLNFADFLLGNFLASKLNEAAYGLENQSKMHMHIINHPLRLFPFFIPRDKIYSTRGLKFVLYFRTNA